MEGEEGGAGGCRSREDRTGENAAAVCRPGTGRRCGYLSSTPWPILFPKMKRVGLRSRLSRTVVGLLAVALASMISAVRSGKVPSVNCLMGMRLDAAIWLS